MAELNSVESSMIKAVGYDPETCILEVVYEGVPAEVYEGLMAAESKGRYMLAEIIDVYPDHRVSNRRQR
jgi:hypothetical protein